ncbi:PKD domain protein [Pigmentiphaga humi]|uniref:PKD domain protein n=1 Tax=Pigmentiphaga humi TaxID=2478468 RepID=A0A3P4B7A7_9BURK|nr:PKD domain-containing protein [Pigmentiphaga humi]VCU71821.1 PKD domain protein [Pigmentiphaga humi]
MNLLRKLMAGLGLAALLAAGGCGGGTSAGDDLGGAGNGGGGGGGNGSSEVTTVLRASVDGKELFNGSVVEAGSAIALDASASTGPAGVALRYSWTIVKQPDYSAASVASPASAQTSFVPALAGQYILGVTVSDGVGSASLQLEFTTTSVYPVAAVQRRERDVTLGMVQLDGRGSQPPTGGDASKLIYAWRLVSVPPGSALTGLDPAEATQAQPRFTADVEGRYEAELSVSYEGRKSLQPATLTLNIVKAPTTPQAIIKAVTPEPFVRGRKVTLSAVDSKPGSRSTGTMQYRWTIAQGGLAPLPELTGANAAELSFVPVAADTYNVTLAVFDGVQVGSADFRVDAAIPDGAANTPPVAMFMHAYNQNTFEIEKGARTELYGRGASYDVDQSPYAGMNYEYTVLEEPAPGAATLERTSMRNTFFTPRTFDGSGAEKYKFQLRVQDLAGAWSEPVTATFTVLNGANRTPTAVPAVSSGSAAVMAGAEVVLTGAGSSDPDKNRLAYTWRMVDKPDGSTATIKNADQAQASFVTDKPGPYKVALVVTDSWGSSSASVALAVFAKSQNSPPEARPYQALPYDREQPLRIAPVLKNVNLFNALPIDMWNGFQFTANAFDPDGDRINYLWTLTGKPDNYTGHKPSETIQSCFSGGRYLPGVDVQEWFDRQMAAEEWDCSAFKLAPSKTGIYDLSLLVTDGAEVAGPFLFSVQAATREDYPTVLLEDLHIGHYWDNTKQGLTLKEEPAWNANISATKQPNQLLFPVTAGVGDGIQGLGLAARFGFSGDFVVKTIRLTAGGDYTIADLKAYDTYGVEKPKFAGLSDGQIVRKGQVLEFQLVWPIANNPEVCDGMQMVGKDGLVWSFRIKELPNFTFEWKPPSSSVAACS